MIRTAAEVDEEVKKLLAECYDKAKQIIRDHLDAMDKIAQFLIEKETITGKEFMKIYREVENIPEPTEEEQEAAKKGRIYATRAESALVGENVPIKSKEEPKVEPEDNNNDGLAFREAIKESSNQYEAPEEEKAQDPQTEDVEAGTSPDPSQIQTGSVFSHVPEDFDKKD
nr:hypothetical protein [Butyrivibrio sp. FCS014]